MKGHSIRSGAVVMATEVSRFVLGLGSTIVLARLLVPEDYGLIAEVVPLMGLIFLFQEGGLATPTTQRAHITQGQVSNLFWLNSLLGFVGMIVMAMCSPLVVWFYSDPRLLWITIAMSTLLLFSGMAVQHQALLIRQMRFVPRAVAELSAVGISIVVGIVAAALGAGYWALVVMEMARTISRLVLLWLVSGWRPGLPVRGSGIRSMVTFGANLVGYNFIYFVVINGAFMLIGWVWGPIILGFYNKAYSLLMMPLRQIGGPARAVALPVLSALQNDPERFRLVFRRALELLVFLCYPLVVISFVMADEIILTILGNQWGESVSVFRALAPASFVLTINIAIFWLFVPLDRSKELLRMTFLSYVVILAAICIGLSWGGVGVAMGFSIGFWVTNIPSLWYACRGTPVRLIHVLESVWRAGVASVITGVAVWWIERIWLESLQPVPVRLAVLVSLFGLLYLILFILLPGGLDKLRHYPGMMKELKGFKRSKPQSDLASSSEQLSVDV